MRLYEFDNTSGYYTLGDQHALNLATAANWPGHASAAATTRYSTINNAISSIPKGSVVVVSFGQNDALNSEDRPEQIASRVQIILDYAKQQDLIPVYLLFPAGNNQRLQSVRDAIKATVNVPTLDLATGAAGPNDTNIQSATYSKIATSIASKIKPVQQNITPNSTPASGDEQQAKQSADEYLGRALSNKEWDWLIRATAAESSSNLKEQGYVMATILNRVRSNFQGGNNVIDILRQTSQFQAVTGTKKNKTPSPVFSNGPSDKRRQSIMYSAVNVLPVVPKDIKYFSATDPGAYKAGTNIGWKKQLEKHGGFIVGRTIFSARA